MSPDKFVVFRLNKAAQLDLLAEMPLEFTDAARQQTVIMEVPMPDGKLGRFRIVESPMLAPKVAGELPGVKTFSGQAEALTAVTTALNRLIGIYRRAVLQLCRMAEFVIPATTRELVRRVELKQRRTEADWSAIRPRLQ